MRTDLPATAPPSVARRRFLLAMLVIVYTVSMIDRTIINTLAQQIQSDLKLSDTQLGLLTGFAFAFVYASMSLPLARASEKWPRMNLVTASLALWSTATALCGLANGFWQLFAARLGVGISEAGFSPPAQSLISDSFPPAQRSSALSIYGLGAPVGAFLGATLGAWIGQRFGWRAAFMLVGAPGLLLAVVMRLTIREPQRGTFDTIATGAAPAYSMRDAMRTIFENVQFRYITLGFTFAGFAGYSLGAFFVVYVQRAFNIGLLQAGSTFGLITGGTGIVGLLAGGFLADRLSNRNPRMPMWVSGIGLFVAAPLMIAAVLQDQLHMMWLFLTAGSILYPIYIGCGFAAAHNLFPSRLRATATSLLLLISTLIGLGTGPVLTGLISDVVAHMTYAGDYAAACRAAPNAPCLAAHAYGLKVALACSLSLFLVAGASFILGALDRPKKSSEEIGKVANA